MSLILKQESAGSVASPSAGKTAIYIDSVTEALTVKQSNGATGGIPTLATSNTQVMFNDSNAIGGSSSFVYANNTNTLTVANLSVTGTLTAGDIAVSSIANGTSNVDIVGVSGNVTVSVGGNANILTVTGTGANISGTLSTSGNATAGNLVTGGQVSATGNITAAALSANGTVGNGVFGGSITSGSTQATGVRGQAFVGASADTAAAVGVRGYAVSTHSGGYNIGVLGNALGSGTGNYAFYIQNGGIASIENTAVWDLYDNSPTSLTFQSSGKANILGIDTTDGAEGIYTSGYFSATGNANVGNIGATKFVGNISGTGNSNVGNLGVSGLVTVTGNVTAGNLVTAGSISATGNANVGSYVNATYLSATGGIYGSIGTASQLNITAVGTLTTLSVSGNANIGNIGTAGLITATGNIQSTAFLVGANLSVTGNANVGNLGVVNILALSNVTAGNIRGVNSVTSGDFISATGNITGANLITGGLITVTGNANIGNIGTAGLITATGNITGGNLLTTGIANAATLTVTGNANVANIGAAVGVFTANVSANNLSTTNKVTAGNGLQVTTGTLTVLAGNLDVTGNLNVTGNVNYSNVTDLVVGDPLIYMGANNTGDTVDLGIVASYNNGSYKHTGLARNASNDYWTFFDGVVAEPTTTIDWANATYPTVKMGPIISTSTISAAGNANVGNIGGTNAVFTTFSGSGSGLTSIPGGNVTGAVAYATTANSVAGANVSGQVSYAAVANSVAGANVSGAVSYATTANSVAGANVSGQVANAAMVNTTVTGTNSAELVRGNMGDNDQARILVGATASNSGYLEIATADDGTEPIYVRQYTGVFSALTRTATLLDSSGNTTFPGSVTAGGFVQTTTLTTGANTTAGTVTGNWTLSAGSKWNATYADLSEKYVADATYDSGTVLIFGGEYEVTISNEPNTSRVAGVVTTNAAYTMNSGLVAEHIADIALQGRVPCKVVGPVTKGDLMVSSSNGHAVANNNARAGTIIGKSLENFSGTTGIIEVAVGRF